MLVVSMEGVTELEAGEVKVAPRHVSEVVFGSSASTTEGRRFDQERVRQYFEDQERDMRAGRK